MLKNVVESALFCALAQRKKVSNVAHTGNTHHKMAYAVIDSGGSIMNKTELISAVAEKTALTKKDSEKAVAAALEAISEALAAGEKVQLVGFGVFETKTRAARTGRNPRTKEEIEIPAGCVPVFKAGKALKDAVSK